MGPLLEAIKRALKGRSQGARFAPTLTYKMKQP
jgi:hypothetical protein